MEKSNNKWHSHSTLWVLTKVFLIAIVILLVLFIGVAAGRHEAGGGERGAMGLRSREMMGNVMYWSKDASQEGVMAPGNNKPVLTGTRIAGVITAVDGTKITLTDNGNNVQTIYASGDTVISTNTAQVGLSSLKPKIFVVCYVTVKDGKNVASSIWLQ